MVFVKGYKHSEETKRKLIEWRKENFKGKNNPFYGKKHSEETKRKIGLKSIGRNIPKKCDGTERQDPSGYVYIKKGRSWIYKHRAVYEEFHKIVLRPRQIIHHIDGNKKNNVVENLELTNPSIHMCYHNAKKRLEKNDTRTKKES